MSEQAVAEIEAPVKKAEKKNILDSLPKANETFRFAMIGYGDRDPIDTQRILKPGGPAWEAVETITDPNTGEVLINQWVDGTMYDKKEGKSVEKTGRIEFDKGLVITHGIKQYAKYRYMKFSHFNKSNPYRDPSFPAYFYEVVAAQKETSLLKKEELEDDAKAIIKRMCNSEEGIQELLNYARALNVNTNRLFEEIKWDMIVLAKRDPATFIANSTSKRMKMKAILVNAEEGKIIHYASNNHAWVWTAEKSTFHQCVNGTDRYDSMLNWALEDRKGETVYKEIEKRVGQPTLKKK